MKSSMQVFLLCCWCLSGCATYNRNDGACHTLADCNPDKACGELVRCIDGRCDPDQTLDLPCDQGCQGDDQCPEGMHCQEEADGEGICVLDGRCQEASECLGLPHGACLGSFHCRSGACVYECMDVTGCARDAECLLADRGCCCGSREEDYVAIAEDDFAAWTSRPECDGVACPRTLCHVPANIQAACREGQCVVETVNPDWFSCQEDGECVLVFEGCCSADGLHSYLSVRDDRVDDWLRREECAGILCEECWYCPYGGPAVCWGGACIRSFCNQGLGRCDLREADPLGCSSDGDCLKTDIDCCGCSAGGQEGAVSRDMRDAFAEDLAWQCSMIDIACYDVDLCTDRPAACESGRCRVADEPCDCPHLWDPVCVLADGGPTTLANECEAACLGIAWFYHGACECQMDCDCGDPLYNCSACAANGQTYACGQAEIECNGQWYLYPGTCDPSCDDCTNVPGPLTPVCGADFYTYADACFVECLGRDWWHEGACLPGEGGGCGQVCGVPCLSGDLYCLGGSTECAPPGGSCILLGACLEAADCEGQPLPHDDCEGRWICASHVCAWECG